MSNAMNYSSYCFFCGSENPQGLHLLDSEQDGKHYLHLDIHEALCGSDGTLCSSITAGLLDEAMWYAVHALETPAVTTNLKLTILKEPITGQAVDACGTLIEQGEVYLKAKAELRDRASGELLANAYGTFKKIDFGKFKKSFVC